jgi:hypothetical protein
MLVYQRVTGIGQEKSIQRGHIGHIRCEFLSKPETTAVDLKQQFTSIYPVGFALQNTKF